MTEVVVDYELVRMLREQVADEMTRAKQQREIRGLRELSQSDEYQFAVSVITTAVQRHLRDFWRQAGNCPLTPDMTCGSFRQLMRPCLRPGSCKNSLTTLTAIRGTVYCRR